MSFFGFVRNLMLFPMGPKIETRKPWWTAKVNAQQRCTIVR